MNSLEKVMTTVQGQPSDRLTEEKLRAANRTLRMLSECHRALVRTANESDLLHNVCQTIVQVGGYRLAWVGFAEQDEAKTVRPAAQVGFEDGYLDTVNITWANTEHGHGPTGTAIRTGKPNICKNVLTDPKYAPWRAEATKRGYASSIALPLLAGGQTLGALNIYATEADVFDAQEVELLAELADNLVYGTMTLRTRAEHRQAGQALRKQLLQNEQILQTTMDGYILVDSDGKLIDVNPAYCEMIGYSRVELLNMSIQQLDIQLSPEEIERMVQHGADRFESRHKSKDGRVIDLDVSIAIMQPEQYPLVAAFVRDITERKQSDGALQQRARELAALNALGQQVGATLSLDQVVQAALDDIIGPTQCDLALFFLREDERLILQGVTLTGSEHSHEETPVHRVGECLCGLAVSEGQPVFASNVQTDPRCTWEECKKAGLHSFAALPLYGGDEIIGVLGLASVRRRDFGEQAIFLETMSNQIAAAFYNALLHEQVQRRLKELTAIYQASQRLQQLHTLDILAQEFIQIMEQTLDYEYGSVLLVDESTGHLLPFALSDQGKGASFIEQDKAYVASHGICLGTGITGWVAQTGQSVRTGDVRQHPRYYPIRDDIRSELCVPLRIGEQTIGAVNVETPRLNAYTEADQRVLETIAAQIAVALQNARLYEQIQHHAAELEQRVAERTAELEAKNQALETFTYSVSHDLKAPLRGIDGYSRLLLEYHVDRLDEEGRTFLHSIRHATGQMRQLIDDLLAYSRLERRSLTTGRIDPRALIEALLIERADEIGQRNVSLTLNVSCEPVVADAEGLTQALRNLLDNALKFTHEVSEPRVEIGGRDTENGCILWVRDNGIGFDMQYHDHIFDIFQRLHRAEDYPGTGIGLAIVRKALERMGGRAWAESSPGTGATFYLEIGR